jgi:WD40 repeat protein
MSVLVSVLTLPLLLAAPPEKALELKEGRTFKGHTFDVTRVAVTADGKLLASGGGDTRGGELKLWEAATGKEIGSFPGYTNSLNALAFSADGKWLASGGIDNKLLLWDVASRKQRAALGGHTDWAIIAVAFSPDGKRLASAGRKEVKLWDLKSGKPIASFGRIVEAGGAGFNRDLTLLASPNYQEIDLWDVTAGKERAVLSEQRGAVRCVAFSTDGKLLAAASAINLGEFHYRGEVKLWDVTTGKERSVLKGKFGDAEALALSPDGRTLALLERSHLEADTELKLLDVTSSRVLLARKLPGRWPLLLTFLPDGRLLVATNSGDHAFQLWQVPPRK